MHELPVQQLVDTLRMPVIQLKGCRVKHTVWQIFKAHHYLIDTMHQAARCTLFVWQQVELLPRVRCLEAAGANSGSRTAGRHRRPRRRRIRLPGRAALAPVDQ